MFCDPLWIRFIIRGQVTKRQLVLFPNVGDKIIKARIMGGDLKVEVEVARGEEDVLFRD
ncbi:hypothetical protein NC651_024263 [Populus alba x Populus x berolinensis]|nr:hypothetical protein NC651_024263 [Populus alba x Populus x berolinensis]